MATAFTHAAVGGALGQTLPRALRGWRIAALLAFVAVLPDFDVVAFKLGIPYEHPLGHRGFSHSLLFAALVGVLTSCLVLASEAFRSARFWWLAAVTFVVAASHGLLDAATDAGRGIGFFIPFDNGRYFLPFRPLETSSVSPATFFANGRRVITILVNEALWVGLPLVGLSAAARLWRRVRRRKQTP
jgi:inner membrane protein